ncbi:unnamed protein product [Allacma fusca]|uniref:Uncharacterized protein n=1 Tax=Allacma fusca TaxID=39272 RepID=A0A8J2PJY5_9HEXA|nr:unnamed protein product [Allacma fusca]
MIMSVILIVIKAVYLVVSHSSGLYNDDSVMIVTTVGTFILHILSIMMAIFLLHGSYRKNTFQLTAWMVYTVIWLVILTIHTIVQCVAFPFPYYLLFSGIGLVFVILIEWFFLWVVGTHLKEIKASALVPYPVIKA